MAVTRVARVTLGCAALVAMTCLPCAAPAQVIGGVVRDTGGRPLAGVTVTIPGENGWPGARADTPGDGSFLLTVPRGGAYRLQFLVGNAPTFRSDTIAVTADGFVQREFRLPIPPDLAYFEFQVTKPVLQARGSPGPRYPEDLKRANVEGGIFAEFVVDTLGRVRPGTFKVLRATHPGFVAAVREALPKMRFVPAERLGRKVPQIVQQPFTFQLTF